MAAPELQSSRDRRRRRRLRLIPIVGYSIAVLGLAYFFEQRPSTTILFVRHADTLPAAGDDPGLSARGQQRAELLADFLQDIDVVAGVDVIYVSDQRRTQETAAPLAARLKVPVVQANPYETVRFMNRVQRDHSGEIVLIVTDADVIAPLIDEVHGSKRLPAFAPDEYDELYIVTIPWYGKVKTLRLHYSAPKGFDSIAPSPLSGG
jgi:2,3-bisphosphoglycerate-dependent phosphoglycerate mutase